MCTRSPLRSSKYVTRSEHSLATLHDFRHIGVNILMVFKIEDIGRH